MWKPCAVPNCTGRPLLRLEPVDAAIVLCADHAGALLRGVRLERILGRSDAGERHWRGGKKRAPLPR
jgi:hypothetical protein